MKGIHIHMTDVTDTTRESVLALIRNRRSIGRVTDEVPPRAVIEELLEAAIWAPNHNMSEPWRFIVLSGDARNALGRAMAEAETAGVDDPEKAEKARTRALAKPLRAPCVIVAISEPQGHNPAIEEHTATAAAIQNLLLAAETHGLGVMWRTGGATYAPQVRDLFGVSEEGQIIGFIYIGYPAIEKPTRDRTPIEEITAWWDSDPAASEQEVQE